MELQYLCVHKGNLMSSVMYYFLQWVFKKGVTKSPWGGTLLVESDDGLQIVLYCCGWLGV